MEFAGFATADQARAWRRGRGGWVFECADGGALWFALGTTPSAIMAHHATRGKSGRLT